MIAHLKGTVTQVALDRAVIDVGGLGHLFYATPSTLSHLREGEEAKVFTHLVVREDALTLYGFQTKPEQEAFVILIGINGVGPKLALATLAVYQPNQLADSVANKDEAALCRIPGVGKKSAQRMIVEIGDKLAFLRSSQNNSGEAMAGGVDTSIAQTVAGHPEVVQALEQLGWKKNIAEKAVARAVEEKPEGSVAELLRAALQVLGGAR